MDWLIIIALVFMGFVSIGTLLSSYKRYLAKRDLKQQAKGLEDYANLTLKPGMGDGYRHGYCSGFAGALTASLSQAKQLRKQAEEL